MFIVADLVSLAIKPIFSKASARNFGTYTNYIGEVEDLGEPSQSLAKANAARIQEVSRGMRSESKYNWPRREKTCLQVFAHNKRRIRVV